PHARRPIRYRQPRSPSRVQCEPQVLQCPCSYAPLSLLDCHLASTRRTREHFGLPLHVIELRAHLGHGPKRPVLLNHEHIPLLCFELGFCCFTHLLSFPLDRKLYPVLFTLW